MSADAMLAQISPAQNGFPRDWLATSRACAGVAVGGSRRLICDASSGASVTGEAA